MIGRFWFLLFSLICTVGFAQEQDSGERIADVAQLRSTYQSAVTDGDSTAIFDAANALVAYFNAQANLDSIYFYQEVLIKYFDGTHQIDQYIESLKNNYFMDRRFGRRDLANQRVQQITPWLINQRISMKNKSDIAFLLSGYHQANGQIDSMLDYQLKSITYADSIVESNRLPVVTRAQMGLILEGIGRYAEALDFLTEAEPLMERITYPAILKIQLYETIAKAMVQIKDTKTAEEYVEKMSEIIRKNNYSSMHHRIANVKAHIAKGNGDYAEALKLYRRAFRLADEKAKNKPFKTSSQINAAFMHLRLNDLSGALPLVDSINTIGNLNNRERVLLNMLWTDYYIKSGNLNKAANYLDQVNAFDLSPNHHEQSIAELNRRFHNKAGNTVQEMKFLRQHARIKDSLDGIANKSVARRLEAEFNREKQTIEISALTQTNIEKDKALAIRNTLIWMGGISLLVLGGLLFGLYRLYIKNQENQKQLALQNKQISQSLATNELLMKEIHHRVKNNLQVVSSLLNMQARKSRDPITKDALQSSKSRVQSMSILHKSLYKNDSPTKVDVNDYFSEIIENIQDTYEDTVPITFHLDIANLLLDVDTLVPLGLIVNELITNAYKHAFLSQSTGQIHVTFKPETAGNVIALRVSDNGSGLPEGQLTAKAGSLGNKLIKEFTRRLGGKMKIEPKETGTSICINFKSDDLKEPI